MLNLHDLSVAIYKRATDSGCIILAHGSSRDVWVWCGAGTDDAGFDEALSNHDASGDTTAFGHCGAARNVPGDFAVATVSPTNY